MCVSSSQIMVSHSELDGGVDLSINILDQNTNQYEQTG